MNKDLILRIKNQLDSLMQTVQDEQIEFWFARDLQELLGYTRWENFITAIQRAIESCKSIGFNPKTIFVASRKWSYLAAVLNDK